MKTFTAFVAILASGALSAPFNKTVDAKDVISSLPTNVTLPLLTAKTNATKGASNNYTAMVADMNAKEMTKHEEKRTLIVARDTNATSNATVSEVAARAINMATAPSGVVSRTSNVTASDSGIEGMSKAQVAQYRALAMAQAHEQFKRSNNVSTMSLAATNSTPPVPGECLINGPCPFLGGDGLCNNFCQKCAPPGKQGQGKCEGFLFVLSCTCTFT